MNQIDFGITYALFMALGFVVMQWMNNFNGSSKLLYGLLIIESLGISLGGLVISIWAIFEYGWMVILFYLGALIATFPISKLLFSIGLPGAGSVGMVVVPICAYRLITGLAGW